MIRKMEALRAKRRASLIVALNPLLGGRCDVAVDVEAFASGWMSFHLLCLWSPVAL